MIRATYVFRGVEIVAETDDSPGARSRLGKEIGQKIGAIIVHDGLKLDGEEK